jgi:hypothetical protein
MHGNWLYLVAGIVLFLFNIDSISTYKKNHSTNNLLFLIFNVISCVLSFTQFFYPVSIWPISPLVKLLLAILWLTFITLSAIYILTKYFISRKNQKLN